MAGMTTTMRAAQGLGYGPIDEMLVVRDDVARPVAPAAGAKGRMLVRVAACALAPGDVRVLSGKTRELQGPPSMPYVPGGDVAGVVVAPGDSGFQAGDRVVAMFTGPRDGLAELALVQTKAAAKIPDNVSFQEAATLGSSGISAFQVAKRIRKGDRVLVLGGSGGVGTFLVQLAKLNGASYVASTTSHPERLAALGCVDRVVNYETEDVMAVDEFKKDPFDTVIDLACSDWRKLLRSPIVKSGFAGGRFFTLNDRAEFELHSVPQAIFTLLLPNVWRNVVTFVDRTRPRYRYVLAIDGPARDNLRAMVDLVAQGKVRAVIDPAGPFPFTTEGVKAAFHLQKSRHAYGKVVVDVSPLNSQPPAADRAGSAVV